MRPEHGPPSASGQRCTRGLSGNYPATEPEQQTRAWLDSVPACPSLITCQPRTWGGVTPGGPRRTSDKIHEPRRLDTGGHTSSLLRTHGRSAALTTCSGPLHHKQGRNQPQQKSGPARPCSSSSSDLRPRRALNVALYKFKNFPETWQKLCPDLVLTHQLLPV